MFSKLSQLREEREEGFTLIELLVVILIIGILSAIAIPAFLNQRKSAVDSSVKSDVANAAKVIETWMIKNPSKDVPAGSVIYNSNGTPTITSALTAQGLNGFKVSDGTELTISPITGQRGTYTIKGVNSGGDQADPAGTGILYDSTKGGMQK
jgi:type IV pilus assembly protein PilA